MSQMSNEQHPSKLPKSEQSRAELLTVEQLFKLLQQHLNLWSKPEGLSKIYPQATALSSRLVKAYHQRPSKWVAQLHLHKPHYDYVTNITAKAVIFTCICVEQLSYTTDNQSSIVGATLSANIAALNILTRQANGHPLTDKHKAILARSHILSYKLLIKNKVLDGLWLQSLAGAIPQVHSKRHSRGHEGTIVALACLAGKLLANPKKANQITVSQVMRQLYLETKLPFATDICQLALTRLHRYGDGVIVKLQNQQLAQLIELAPQAIVKEATDNTDNTNKESTDQQIEPKFEREDGYIAFVFSDYPNSFAGRFIILAKHHLKSFEPCLSCDNPKIYAQIWEAPLTRFIAEKGLTAPAKPQPVSIFTPPEELVSIVAQLFNQVSLHKIAKQVKASQNLNQIVIHTATTAAKAEVTIKDAKHAIALLGLNRIGPILYRGAMVERLSNIQFAGRHLIDNRFNCLLAAIEHFNQFNDLVQLEPLLMYMQFYLAPWYLNHQVQQSALKLYQQHPVQSTDLLTIAGLLNLDSENKDHSEQHQTDIKRLLDQWQLPKFAHQLIRHIQTPAEQLQAEQLKVAKPVASAIAVIKLSIYHCNTLFNHPELIDQPRNDTGIQQQLNHCLATLRIKPQHFNTAQTQFFQHHKVYTPLI